MSKDNRYRQSGPPPMLMALVVLAMAVIIAGSPLYFKLYNAGMTCILSGLALAGITGGFIAYDLFRTSQRKLAQEASRREIEVRRQVRERQMTSAWLRAMGDIYPTHDLESFPKRPADLDPTRLELLATRVYSRLGYQATHNGGAGDEGIDVLLYQAGQAVGAVQCKQYQTSVKPNHVRELYGSIGSKIKGYLWAPVGFTNASREWAARYPRIHLLDGEAILSLVERAYPPPAAQVVPQPEVKPTTVVLPAAKAIQVQSTFDPLKLTNLMESLGKHTGLTANQIYVLIAIVMLGIILVTILGVVAVSVGFR